MNKIFTVKCLGVLFLVLFNFSIKVYSQNELPEYDQIPWEFFQLINEDLKDNPDVVITDQSGYDNFNMGTAFAEPHLSQNPNNALQFFTAYNTNTAYRTSNGFDWLTSAPPFGVSVQGDPVTAYDSLGNLYYESMFGNITGCKVMRSTDNGATWFAAVTSVNGVDKNWLAADQSSGPYSNYLYTTMTSGTSGQGNFARSTDFGATFTQTATFNTQSLPGMMVAVGPNLVEGDVPGGCVYVVTNSGLAYQSTYTFYVSTNGGTSFTMKSAQNFANYVGTYVSSRNSVQNMRTRPYPFITADNSYGPHRGRLYLVYASNTPAGSGNKPDIFCRYSDDQGATWSSAVIVNDDENSTLNHQWHPSIWCDKISGRLFVKWMDTRDTPTSDSAHIYATYSDDGGVTFAPNQRITTAKMKINCTTCGGGGTPMYLGDYDAITAIDNQGLIAWTDFRAGTFGSYTAYFPDYAMTVTPAVDSVGNDQDSVIYNLNVPSVKLYGSQVIFSAVITPTPAAGSFTIEYPEGNILSTFPGTLPLKIKTNDNVSVGTYTLTITGTGPNGTPVHKRTVSMYVGLYVPVELTSFSASVDKNDVTLNWITASELNNLGFEIQKKNLKGEFESIGFVNGKGTTTNINEYTFTDKQVNAGNYVYRLMQKDFDGTINYSETVNVEVSLPLQFSLEQNYPNPFNPSTTITYAVPVAEFVSIKLYDVLGNEVTTLVNEVRQPGKYDLLYNAGNLSSGVYYYQIKAGNFTQTKKLMLMK